MREQNASTLLCHGPGAVRAVAGVNSFMGGCFRHAYKTLLNESRKLGEVGAQTLVSLRTRAASSSPFIDEPDDRAVFVRRVGFDLDSVC
jgi:hypothetical protein